MQGVEQNKSRSNASISLQEQAKKMEIETRAASNTVIQTANGVNTGLTIRDLAMKDPKKALNQLSIKYAAKKREIQALTGKVTDVSNDTLLTTINLDRMIRRSRSSRKK